MRSGWSIVPLSGVRRLADQEAAWRAALAEAATERLFLRPEWVLPWLETFKQAPRALFALEHGRPRGAAILVAGRLGTVDGGPVVLRPPGLGVSDSLDLLLPREAAAEAAEALTEWLLEAGGWDLLDLPSLPAESPTAALVGAAARQRGLATLAIETHRRPYLELAGSWESYLASRPQKLRYNLRARRRRLAELGEVCYRHATTPDEVAELLPRAVEVHARRWRGQHTSTTFSSSPTARGFYAEACRRVAAAGGLELGSLELDGRLVAFSLCFVDSGKLYYYLPAFDPEFARFGPSADLLAHLIEWAYARGLKELDFMLGEEAYKEQWASGSRATARLVVAAPGPRGRLALAAFRAYLAARERARRSPLLQRARRYGVGRAREWLQHSPLSS